jgi:mono/diheme cytochrome c family protein
MRCDRIVFVLMCELFLAGMIIVPCGCGSARPGDPPDDPPPQTPAVQRGQQIFVQNCNACHPGGAAGVGPALNDKPLTESLIRSQVRNGKGIIEPPKTSA